MNGSQYVPDLTCGARALFSKSGTAKDSQLCTVIGAVPNPSGRAENQWYDVRFDDYSVLRVHARFLLIRESSRIEQ
jgi:hypothetical protein